MLQTTTLNPTSYRRSWGTKAPLPPPPPPPTRGGGGPKRPLPPPPHEISIPVFICGEQWRSDVMEGEHGVCRTSVTVTVKRTVPANSCMLHSWFTGVSGSAFEPGGDNLNICLKCSSKKLVRTCLPNPFLGLVLVNCYCMSIRTVVVWRFWVWHRKIAPAVKVQRHESFS